MLCRVNHALSGNADFSTPPKAVKLASGSRMVFPLSLLHANDYAARRVVLVGDAAHTVHPLAGQGVNMGFGDASALSRIISESVAIGTDIGEVSLLKKYESERKIANVAMMAVVDGFQKAYSVDFGPLNILRAAAFHGAHYISPLKKTIISSSYSGLVSQAYIYFNSMLNDYAIEPGIEHYACLVDALGRAGHVKEAEELIRCIPFKASASMYRALLVACQLQGDAETGKRVGKKVLALEPFDAAGYVLLSNIYTSVNQWDGMKNARMSMRRRKVRKDPGFSWIDEKNKA